MTDRPNILYLVHRVPYPPDKGDRIRNFHVLRYLSNRARVHLACLADEPMPDEDMQALSRFCERLAVVPLAPRMRWVQAASSVARGRTVSEGAFASRQFGETLASWTRETQFSAVLVSASSLVPYLDDDLLRDIPAVVDLVDVDSQKWLDYEAASRGPRAWLYRMEGSRLRRLEHSLPDRMEAVTLVSEAEVSLFRRFRPHGAIHAIPNGVDLNYFQPSFVNGHCATRRDSCVFVGALDYRPNVDGARWFCSEVWPEVVRRRPHATLRLVGRRPNAAVKRLANEPGVELVGQVPDVRPYVAEAEVVVVPLRLARGLQNKVLEAMAMGKAVVASPESLKGIAANPGEHLVAASTPHEWVDAIENLFDDAALRTQLGAAGRQYVEQKHDWDRCLEPFAALLGLHPKNPKNSQSSAACY